MATPRAVWSGRLRLSLVSIPVQLYPATTSASKLRLHQVHEPTGKRVRHEKVVPGEGPVDTDEIIKGYEYDKGRYLTFDPEEIEELKVEASKTVELAQFVDWDDIDPRYYRKPYYVMPDGEHAYEGYAVIREALRKARKVALGQVVLSRKAHICAIRPCGDGMLLETLRYAHELRAADRFFGDIPDVEVEDEPLEMAEELIDKKTGDFDPQDFHDTYAEALEETIEAKLEEREPEALEEAEEPSGKVVDLMSALKKSLKEEDEGKSGKKASRSSRSKSGFKGGEKKRASGG